jgi:glucuronate isomerase
MTDLETRLLEAIMAIRAVDCHSHVPPESPHARSLADLLGYHYYTELAHAAGMPAEAVEESQPDAARVAELVARLDAFDNTVMHAWLMEAARELFAFGADRLTARNWPELDQVIATLAKQEGRHRAVLSKARIEKVFLTNCFDEDLAGVDREVFVPCLRTDDLIFGLADGEVRRRLAAKTGVEVASADSLRSAVAWLMRYFTQHGAASAAVSLPPDFVPAAPDEAAAEKIIAKAVRERDTTADERRTLAALALNVVAETCRQFHKPFQLMIGVIRNLYPAGVEGGRDLVSKRGSLSDYAGLFTRYPQVNFTVSVLSAAWEHELTAMARIVPNCIPSGHWWYLNLPAHIEPDLRARLESVPKTKLIGYYSDMYKVEFGLPKFNMYRRCLARVLAREFVETRRLTEPQALQVALLLLHDNPARIFGM